MRRMTATEASTRFSELLDAIEFGRRSPDAWNRPVAEIRPASRRNGRTVREALEGLPPLDDKVVNPWTDS